MEITSDNKFIPEIIGETERLVIRELCPDDIPAYQGLVDMCEGGADPELKGLSPEEFRARHMAYIKYQYGFYGYGIWGLFSKSGDFVGIAGVHNSDASGIGELSYAVLPEYRRQGLTMEALRYITEYATGEYIGFDELVARIAPDNIPSLKLAARLGIRVVR